MATSLNTSVSARDRSENLIHFLRKRFTLGQAGGLATTVSAVVGVIPANAAIVSGGGVWVLDTTDATTQTIDIGYAADSLSSSDVNAYATALLIPQTTGGFVPLDEIVAATGVTAKPRSVDTTVIVTLTGATTTGQIDVCIPYMTFNNA